MNATAGARMRESDAALFWYKSLTAASELCGCAAFFVLFLAAPFGPGQATNIKAGSRGPEPHAIDATPPNKSSLNNKLRSFPETRDRRREGRGYRTRFPSCHSGLG